MLKVFNCGYGMLVIISETELNRLEKGKYDILGKVI
jgi:phosphoribosylaminoimidazole (AIR) synthetase